MLIENSLNNFARQSFVWLMSFASFLLFPGRRRFLILFPPLSKRNFIYRRGTPGKRNTLDRVELETSFDYDTALQVFGGQDYDLSLVGLSSDVEKELDIARADGRTPVIIDVGANIGLSALFFAREYPSTHIVAIEPSPANCAQIVKNLAGIDASRIKILEAAMTADNAPKTVLLDISGGNNAFRIFNQTPSQSSSIQLSVPALGISSVVRDLLTQGYHPAILKIDVEGAEAEIFRDQPTIADKFKLIIVEPHDWLFGKAVSAPFLAFHSSFNRRFKMRNENIFSLRTDA